MIEKPQRYSYYSEYLQLFGAEGGPFRRLEIRNLLVNKGDNWNLPGVTGMASNLLKEAERLSKKQKLLRTLQLEQIGQISKLIDEARDELQNMGDASPSAVHSRAGMHIAAGAAKEIHVQHAPHNDRPKDAVPPPATRPARPRPMG